MTEQEESPDAPRAEAGAADEVRAQGSKKNERSTVAFPYVDLASAVAVARAVEQESGYIDRLPSALGYSSVENGSFRLRLAAARTFGLVLVRRDRAELTDLGRRITESASSARATVESFMYVPLYKEVYERHKGRPLPGDTALEADLVALGVAPKQKVKARQVLKKSAEQAGFYDPRSGRLAWPKVETYPEGVEEKVPSTVVGAKGDEAVPPATGRAGFDANVIAGLPPAFVGLVRQLAENGATWSEEERKAWVQAMEVTFTFVWPRSRGPRDSGQYQQP